MGEDRVMLGSLRVGRRGPLGVDVPKAGQEWEPQGPPRHVQAKLEATIHPYKLAGRATGTGRQRRTPARVVRGRWRAGETERHHPVAARDDERPRCESRASRRCRLEAEVAVPRARERKSAADVELRLSRA